MDLGIQQSFTDTGALVSATSVNELPGGSSMIDSEQNHSLHTTDPVGASQRIPMPTNSSAAQAAYRRNGLPDLMQSQQWNLLPPGGPGVDMFSPYFALDNLEPMAGAGTTDLMQSEIDHEFLDIDGWEPEPGLMI